MAFSTMNIVFPAFVTLLLASTSCARNSLLSGERLNGGQTLSEGSYNFIMQNDCNLVLYDVDHPIWSSRTNGRGPGCYLSMQTDGNLVIYRGSTAVWASNTNRNRGSYILTVQRDRNVVIYTLPNRVAIWATGTNVRGSAGVQIAGKYDTAGVIFPEQDGATGVTAGERNSTIGK